ncbi:MAG: sugar transferase [Clostridia bacterium]|nr:sugar transferase [Clostridia bacterium]
MGYFYARYLKKTELTYEPPRRVVLCTALIVIGFALDFIYAQSVPLWVELTHSEETYMDFDHFPILHVIVFTFAFFYAVNMFYHFLQEKRWKRRLVYLAVILLILFLFLCLYNRAVLLMIGFMCAMLFLSYRKKIRWWHIAVVAVLAIVALYLFGVMGNVRSGSPWNDTSYIFEIAQIDEEKWPAFIPEPFAWAYVYLVTPLGNLNHYVQNFAVDWSFSGVLSCIIPDALVNRIFSDISFVIPPAIEQLTVSSGFATAYMYGGYIGMIVVFVYMVLFVWGLTRLSLVYPKSTPAVISIVTCVVAFVFFDNFFNYTGVTLSLVYPMLPIVLIIWRAWRKKHPKKEKPACPEKPPRKKSGFGYWMYRFIKRAFDIFASGLFILIFSWLYLILAIVVKCSDGGSVFYKHPRVGKNGKIIYVRKFRSMIKNADKVQVQLTPEQLEQYRREYKVDNDPRITKVGKFLRKTSLDELPNVFAIFTGAISVIGPRPIMREEAENKYGENVDKLLSVKPGMIGWWAANGRSNCTYESGERQKMELYYVDHCSIWLDIKIIFKTAIKVFLREGAQ